MADVKLNKKLNLVSEVDLTDGTTATVYSIPIAYEIFERHFLLMSKTVTAIYSEGLGVITGPRVAAMLLQRVATAEEGRENNGAHTLLAEIRRLSTVLVPSPQGYEMRPLQEVVTQRLVDDEALSELDNALVFFTLVSVVFKRDQRASALDGMTSLWGTRTTPSTLSECMHSLATSTETASSTAKAGSSAPS